MFEMAELRFCSVALMDRKKIANAMNILVIDRDIVELLQLRRLTCFGHVSRMQPDIVCKLLSCYRSTFFCMDTSLEVDFMKDQGK